MRIMNKILGLRPDINNVIISCAQIRLAAGAGKETVCHDKSRGGKIYRKIVLKAEVYSL